MKLYITILFVGCCILSSFALPVTQTKKDQKEESSPPEAPDLEVSVGYERYMKEVATVLRSDPHFSAKLENATEEEMLSGRIAEHLPTLSTNVRQKLDEIKRRELQRLKELMEIRNAIDGDDSRIRHLDHKNVHTFEIEDFEKLMKQISHDLEVNDQKQKQQFKEYEMEKKFQNEKKKKEMADEQRTKYEQREKEIREKHQKHPKMHYPGNEAQLQEVWEKQDQMDVSDFDLKQFFMLHDLDDNGFLDYYEVNALFVIELDKVYQADLPESDMKERAEEMEHMREKFFNEYDANKDKVISMQEFIERSKLREFKEDPEWDTLEKTPQFTHEEYVEFERRRLEELQRRQQEMSQGNVHGPNVVHQTGQQHPYSNQQQQMHYQNPQQQHMQQQQQYQQQQQQYQQQQQQYQQQQQQQYQQQHQQYQQQHQQYQQQPQHQQHPQYPNQQVNLNPNQVNQPIPVQQHQPQVVNQLPPAQQHQPSVNNLPPQQLPANNNLPPQQPVANNNIPQQQQQFASSNVPPQQPAASSSNIKP